jgi:hypothetical protein
MLKRLIFASALSLFMAGNATAVAHWSSWSAEYSIHGIDYDVALLSGTWDEHEATLVKQPWFDTWPYAASAAEVAQAVAFDGLAPVGTRFAFGQNMGDDEGLYHCYYMPELCDVVVDNFVIIPLPYTPLNVALPDVYMVDDATDWYFEQSVELWAYATLVPYVFECPVDEFCYQVPPGYGVTPVPVPAAGWLFMSALIGLMGKKRLSRRSVH